MQAFNITNFVNVFVFHTILKRSTFSLTGLRLLIEVIQYASFNITNFVNVFAFHAV